MTNPSYILVSEPTTCMVDAAAVKQYVSEINAELLVANVTEDHRNVFPFDTLDVKVLVGDPDYAFTEPVAEMLTTVGVLAREPVLNRYERPVKIKLPDDKGEEVVYHYVWAEKTFADCTQEQLLVVGWDLRTHRGFAHVLLVDEEQQRKLPAPSSSEDSVEDESFDTEDDFSSSDLEAA